MPVSKEIKEISDTYQEKTHILYIPGLNNEPIIDIPFQKLKDTYFYQIQQPFSKQDLSFYDPFFSFVFLCWGSNPGFTHVQTLYH